MEKTTQRIPDKLFFKIGEVSRIADIKPHVLRYWESEFSQLQPVKKKSGQRAYRKKDVELVLKIKILLYSQRYTIEGAKKKLKEKVKPKEEPVKQLSLGLGKSEIREIIAEVKKELRTIVKMLNGNR